MSRIYNKGLYIMDEREQILDCIKKFNCFLIPSRKEIFSIMCDVTKLTTEAKDLFKEGLIDWSIRFDKNSNAIILTKPKEYNYTLTENQERRILNKIQKDGYYVLNSRKVSKIKNWSDYLNFLKVLAKEGKLDWHVDFQKKKYIFRDLSR